MTCQRGRDLTPHGPEHRDPQRHMVCRQKKTRKRRRPFHIPLAPADALRRWKEWVGARVKKYDWDIDPDDAEHPTIHGLRASGILALAEQGYEVEQIANDIGMSRPNVDHYLCSATIRRLAPKAKSNFVSSTKKIRPRTMVFPSRLLPKLPTCDRQLCIAG
jgi:hypothetical protein